MRDIMIDIETFGNRSHSIVLSIGAVQFDIQTGETGKTFYKKIDLQSAMDAGLKINASTLKWWMEQNHEALIELFSGETEKLKDVLDSFGVFIEEIESHIMSDGDNETERARVWGNGARFDLGILEDAYEAVGKKTPWYFRGEMDVRTLVAFAPEVKKRMKNEFDGVEHNALHDCYHQIKYCSEIWNKLKTVENV
jgi:hypothetical protein